jgi:ribonuclease VapC
VSVVLDASALLAFLNRETGAEVVAEQLAVGAIMRSVNLSEVVAKLGEQGMPLTEIENAVSDLGLQVEPFHESLAYAAGELRVVTRDLGLSLGERTCLALSIRSGHRALSADRAWQKLGHIPGLAVEQIR